MTKTLKQQPTLPNILAHVPTWRRATCIVCAGEFERHGMGPAPKCCSTRCRVALCRQRAKVAAEVAPIKKRPARKRAAKAKVSLRHQSAKKPRSRPLSPLRRSPR